MEMMSAMTRRTCSRDKFFPCLRGILLYGYAILYVQHDDGKELCAVSCGDMDRIFLHLFCSSRLALSVFRGFRRVGRSLHFTVLTE